ncbi:MAG: CopD family protein [Trueperaceae bacterium]|nr:CopD family protein [Trueperaceae bacterium]
MLETLQVAAQGAGQIGVVLLIGAAWALAVLGPGLSAAEVWRRRLTILASLAWLAVLVGSLGSLPLTLQRVLGRWDLQLVRTFASNTAQGEAVLQRCAAATLVLALMLLALWLARTRPRLLAAAALVAGIWLIDTLSRLAHGAVMEGGLYRALDVVHLLVAGVWGGGLVALALWKWRTTRPEFDSAVKTALRRHSSTGLLGVLTLAASGVIAAQAQLPNTASLTTTSYGLALVLKLALVAATLAVAAYNRWRLLPRLVATDADLASKSRLASALRIEALLLMLVLIATALLTTRPPPHDMF